LDSLRAGKHVLLEKPATVTAEQTIELLKVAKEKNLFFMEACWTRFFPLTYEIQEIIKSGKLGKVNHM
jgi:predicted dehydrogenase